MEDARASCDAAPEYLEATIKIDPAECNAEDIESTVCHELLHCLTKPLENVADTLAGDDEAKQEFAREAAERVVTLLERVIMGMA